MGLLPPHLNGWYEGQSPGDTMLPHHQPAVLLGGAVHEREGDRVDHLHRLARVELQAPCRQPDSERLEGLNPQG